MRVPRGLAVRPVTGRVRLALFSILGGRCDGLRVLDLFAGSGSLGLECLSRGALSAVFVERDRVALASLRANVESAGAAGQCEVVAREVGSFLDALSRRGATFDLVLLDPPYRAGLVVPTLQSAGALLAHGGTVVACHSPDEPVADRVGELAVVDRRRYGESALCFLKRAGEPATQ